MNTKRVSRRKFLGLVGAAGGSAVLAACGATPEPAPTQAPAPTAAPTQAPTVQAQKTVNFAIGAVTSADNLDPAFRTSTSDAQFQAAVYEGLLTRDANLKPVPNLAKSWEPNEDGSEWTFKLQEGVTWHDGEPFTAADVVYTYKRLIDPDVGSSGASNLSAVDPDGIVAVDDHTVRIKLTEPDVEFYDTTIFSQSLIVRDGSTNEDLATKANGTGAFKIDSFIPGELTTEFVKNENYWRPGFPKIDVLRLVSVPEPEAMVAALQSGEVDIITEAPTISFDALESDPNTLLVSNPIGGTVMACCQIDVPPFDNNDLRLAIKWATDREASLQLVQQGRGTLMNDTPVPPGLVPGSLEGVRARDLEKAKEHLAKAGYPDGIDLTLTTTTFGAPRSYIEWATAWQQQLAEVGIRLELDVTPVDTYWGDQWLVKPFFMTAWNVRPVGPGLALWYKSDAEWNETHWMNEEWDAKLAQARSTIDTGQREALYRELQQQIVDEGGHFATHMYPTVDATRSNISGWNPSPAGWVYNNIDVS